MNSTISYLSEQEDNLRLKRATDAMAYCRDQETEARRRLADAVESSRRAKEKYETLFAECEKRAVQRRLSGQIEVNPGY